MDSFQMALLMGALIAGALAWRIPHAALWLLCGATSFVLSAMWERIGLPWRDGFGAFTDLAVVYAIYTMAYAKWELRVFQCFIAMILLDFLHAAGFIDSHYWLIVSLETANWLAILTIGITGIMERAGYADRSVRFSPRLPGVVYRALFAPRKDHPWAWFRS